MTDSTSPSDELAAPEAGSVVGAYFGHLNRLQESDKSPKEVALALARRLGSRHFLSILEIMTEMDRLYREMRSVLNEFTGRSSFLVTILTIEQLTAVMKLYVISWHTMLDLVARAVNAAFDLGIADRDVRLPLVLNNTHVRSSRIPEILERYEKALSIEDLRKRRNDAVHRAWIPDSDLDAMLKERNTIDSRRYSFLETSPISDDEHKRRRLDLQERLGALAKQKRELWEKLHAQTTTMTSEVARELAVKTIELYRKGAI